MLNSDGIQADETSQGWKDKLFSIEMATEARVAVIDVLAEEFDEIVDLAEQAVEINRRLWEENRELRYRILSLEKTDLEIEFCVQHSEIQSLESQLSKAKRGGRKPKTDAEYLADYDRWLHHYEDADLKYKPTSETDWLKRVAANIRRESGDSVDRKTLKHTYQVARKHGRPEISPFENPG